MRSSTFPLTSYNILHQVNWIFTTNFELIQSNFKDNPAHQFPSIPMENHLSLLTFHTITAHFSWPPLGFFIPTQPVLNVLPGASNHLTHFLSIKIHQYASEACCLKLPSQRGNFFLARLYSHKTFTKFSTRVSEIHLSKESLELPASSHARILRKVLGKQTCTWASEFLCRQR